MRCAIARRLALAVAIAFASAQGAAAADSLTVQNRILPDSIHLYGHFHIQPPAGCPISEGVPANLNRVTAYYSAGCRRYVGQDADIALRVFNGGRLVYHETLIGIPGTAPQQGATFDASIYRLELGGQCGAFMWKVTLYDPFFRSSFTVSRLGSFRAPCS